MFKLRTKTLPIENVDEQLMESMFKLFSRYYNNVDEKNFKQDMLKKDHVISLFEKKTGELKGFSTITSLEINVNNKRIRGMFSGDTVIDKEFWGQGSLGIAFLTHLFKEKLNKPFTPLYWFLISKGHKTYLLMANNFKKHYPRFESITPRKNKAIIDGFATKLYPENYKQGTGIISFNCDDKKDFLKTGVAPISDEMIKQNPRIAYFSKVNPGWSKGDELACIAEMTFMLPIQYFVKKTFKLSLKILRQLSNQEVMQKSRGYK